MLNLATGQRARRDVRPGSMEEEEEGREGRVNLSLRGKRERFTRPSVSYQLMWVTTLSLLTEKT